MTFDLKEGGCQIENLIIYSKVVKNVLIFAKFYVVSWDNFLCDFP